ncbi:MAG TPA: ABC transporter permease [Bryobacteraceae bacterium]|nr:ABC transporter permease [Bryobacteraceae bacterium]
MWSDLRFAFRTLLKSPAFALTAICALALGIGANTAIFSIVNGLLLHPSGIQQPDRVAAIRVKYDKFNLKSIGVSVPDFADVRDSRQIFSSAAASDEQDFNYTGGEMPERLLGATVSWQWFRVFGAAPELGREFRPEEDQKGANQVLILSHGTWKRLFGGDRAIVGKKIELNQQPYKVIGVMPPDFRWPQEADLWVPLGLAPAAYSADNRFNENYFGAARIRDGISFARADAFVELLKERLIRAYPQNKYFKDSGWGMFAVPMAEFMFGDLKAPLIILLGAVGFVLLIACSNIAGLMLARASGRSRELAIRSALGAGPWRLIRQTLTESLLLAFAGTVLGIAAAYGGVRALIALAPESLVNGQSIHLDFYVLLFTCAAGILSGVLFGIAPAWQSSRNRSYEALKEGGRSGTASRERQQLRAGLVIGEVSLALVLLVGAGLFLKSLSRLQQVSTGFQTKGVMTAALALPASQYKEAPQQAQFFREAIGKISNLPGVSSAGVITCLPFSGCNSTASFSIEGRTPRPGDPGPWGAVRYVTAGYFPAMRIPLRQGRYFTDADRQGSEPVALIDENLARQYWPNETPIGKKIGRGPAWSRIVGVVAHVKQYGLVGDSGQGVYYFPFYQQPRNFGFLAMRTAADPGSLASAIQRAVREVDPNQPVHDLKTMDERLASSLGPRRFAVTLLGLFAGIALLMAAIGLYGVISYGVSQRTQEIGIRMALGARRGQVLKLIVGQGLRLAGMGVGIGLVASFLLTRLIASQLVGVSAFDPLTFTEMAVFMALVALLAAYLPARRAAKVDPMEALRHE